MARQLEMHFDARIRKGRMRRIGDEGVELVKLSIIRILIFGTMICGAEQAVGKGGVSKIRF